MRRFNALGASVVVALALGATMAAAASAATGLVLKEDGVAVPKGGTVTALILVEGCFQITPGTLTKNDSAKDEASFGGTATTECEEGHALSGKIASAKFSAAKKAEYKSTLLVSKKTCVYEYKKLSVPLNTEGGLVAESGEASGKLDKGASKGSCPKLARTTYTVVVLGADEEPLET